MGKLVEAPERSDFRIVQVSDASKYYVMPIDRFRYVYFVMVFLGIGTLWPYNMIISVTDYFQEKYPDIQNISNIITMILQYPSIFILFIMIRYGAKVSFTTRFASCFPLMAVIIAMIPSIASSGASWSFPVLGIAVFVLGICVSVIQSSSISFASKFPPIYMQALMTGQGVAGMSVNFVLLLIKYLVSRQDIPSQQAGSSGGYSLFIYLSVFVSVIALVLYLGSRYTPYAKHILDLVVPITQVSTPSGGSHSDSFLAEPPQKRVNHRTILRKIWRNGLLVALVFIGTFLMFPGLTFALPSSNIESSWFGLLLVTTFNVMDTIGRFVAGFITIRSARLLWLLVASRLLLYPFFVIHKAGAFHGAGGDTLAFTMIALLALSNGYLASMTMMRTSSYVEKHEEEASSAAMAFFLVAGILLGLNLAFFLSKVFPAYL